MMLEDGSTRHAAKKLAHAPATRADAVHLAKGAFLRIGASHYTQYKRRTSAVATMAAKAPKEASYAEATARPSKETRCTETL